MADKYDIIRSRTGNGLGKWKIIRTDDDPDFGFVKDVGFFDRKDEAEHALGQIKSHSNMNFAEWFYVQRLFYKNRTLDQATIARHFYNVWHAIGGHLSVDTKRGIMAAQAAMLAYVLSEYEDEIDAVEMAHAAQIAGPSW